MTKVLKGSRLRRRNAWIGLLFTSPWIVGFLVFTLLPLINGVLYSLNSVTIKPQGVELTWAGLKFYDYAMNVSTTYKLHLGSSAMMICCATPVVIVFSLVIAVLLNRKFAGRSFFRTVLFMPVIIMSGPVISSLLTGYTVDFTEDGSQIMQLLSSLPSFISSPCVFVLENLVLIFWFSGVQIVIFLAGLQKISPSIYEAADIDGASGWEKFWKITLPHIAPLALICTIYTVVDISNYSENAVNVDISENLFNTSMMYSLSAAMSWIYFAMVMLILAVVYFLFWLMGRRDKA